MDGEKKPSRLDEYIKSAKDKTDNNEVGDWIASKGGHLTIMIVLGLLVIGFIINAIAGLF